MSFNITIKSELPSQTKETLHERNFAKSWLQSPIHNLFLQQHDQRNSMRQFLNPILLVQMYFFFVRLRLKETGQKYECVRQVLNLRPSDDLFFPETVGDLRELG